jgi:hypothetical protein
MHLDCSVLRLLVQVIFQANETFESFRVDTEHWKKKKNRWSKSQGAHIKIFTHICSSIQFDWINKHTVPLWLYKGPLMSHHVVTCWRQSVSCLPTVEVQEFFFSLVQRVFIAEHLVAPRSHLIWQNEFRVTFPDFSLSNKSTVSRPVNSFHETGTLQRLASDVRKKWMQAFLNAVDNSNN